MMKYSSEEELIPQNLKELQLKLKNQTDTLSKRKKVNYLFSCINTETGFTPKQSSYIKKILNEIL